MYSCLPCMYMYNMHDSTMFSWPSPLHEAKDAKGGDAGGNKVDDKKAAKDENKEFQQTMGFLTKVQSLSA